jgi:Ca-activated chloride channel homolog
MLLALTFAAAALARPRLETSKVERHAVVVMLVDVSGSMQAKDVAPTRIAAAIAAMHTFVQKLPPGVKVGLVEFSDEPTVINLPTENHEDVIEALQLLTPQGATALGDGLGTAIGVVRQALGPVGRAHARGAYVPGAIVVLSDGAQNRGTLTPRQAALLAKKAGIRVYTVAFGTPNGTVRFADLPGVYPVPPDPATLNMISAITGGKTFSARTADEATSIYGNLGSTLGRESSQVELTSWFSVAAGVLLVAAIAGGLALGPAVP